MTSAGAGIGIARGCDHAHIASLAHKGMNPGLFGPCWPSFAGCELMTASHADLADMLVGCMLGVTDTVAGSISIDLHFCIAARTSVALC